jgi:hypothetical protein
MAYTQPKRPTDLTQRLGDPNKGSASTKRVTQPANTGPQKGLSGVEPPDSLDDNGKAFFRAVIATADWLTASDTVGLEFLARTHQKVVAALDDPHLSPPQVAALAKTYSTMLEQFGLTPRARITLGLQIAETKSKLDTFREEAAGQ